MEAKGGSKNSKSEGDLKDTKKGGGETVDSKSEETESGGFVIPKIIISPELKMSEGGEKGKERYGPISRIPVLEEFNDFETWTKCVSAWSKTCNIPKEQQGFYLCQELPIASGKYGNNLREDVFRQCPPDDLVENEDGVDNIIAFLKTRFWIDQESAVYETHRNLKTIWRKKGQALNDYIIEFDKLYSKAKQLKIIPVGVSMDMCMALDLMITAELSEVEYMMIKSAVEVMAGDGKRFELVKSKIREILIGKSNVVEYKKSEESFLNQDSKREDDFNNSSTTDDVYLSKGWTPPNKSPYGNKRYQNNKTRYQGKNWGNKSNSGYNDNKSKTFIRTKPTNPLGKDGKPLKCMSCQAITHMIKDCPDTYENQNSYKQKKRYQTAYLVNEETQEEEKVLVPISDSESEQEQGAVYCAVYCSENIEDMNKFTAEALNKAALDTACTASIAGEKWLQIYLDALPTKMKEKVTGPLPSQKYFLFGNQGKLKSTAKYIIPTKLGGDENEIELDIIKSDIPLLLSKGEMKKLGIMLDMKNDKALINGKPLLLTTTSAGHYVVDLLNNEEEIETVCIAELDEDDTKNQMKALTKIHRQFGHRSKLQFVTILKEAGKWQDKFSCMIDKIMERCEGCILRLRTPDRPAVAPPLASDFGQVLGVDLKVWDKNKGIYIFYMIDIFTRYQMATIIRSKEPSEIVKAFTTKWLPIFGRVTKILSDNGTEFQNEQMREVASALNVELLTTGANAPWQNGIVERNHMTSDSIISAVLRDYPKMSLEVALAWAINAVNSMSSVRGFSPYQLVFGRSIKLPNILEDPPPAWEEPQQSKHLIDTLNAIHKARVEYTKAERCERIRKALKAKIRVNDTLYNKGDIVYFKKETEDTWRGPAKVVFQDSKVIFLRIGSVYYRVSANRVKKAGESLARDIVEKEEELEQRQTVTNTNNEPSTIVTRRQHTVPDEPDWHRLRIEDNDEPNTNIEEVTPGNEESEIPITTQEGVRTGENIPEPITEPEIETEHSDQNIQEGANNQNKGRKRKKVNQKPTPEFNEDRTLKNAENVLKRNDRIEIMEKGKWEKGTILGHGGKVTGKHRGWYNIQLDNGQLFPTEMSTRQVRYEEDLCEDSDEAEALMIIQLDNGNKLEIKNIKNRMIRIEKEGDEIALLVSEDVLAVMVPREQRNSPECMTAKQDELNKLLAFNTYQVVEDKGQDHITTTWVLTEKGTEKRARLTARGFQEDTTFPTDSPTVQKHSMRLLLAIAATEGWDICTTDISSAFLQGSDMDRHVHVKPPREANQPGKLWLLNKCLYGLKDASRKWYLRVLEKLKELDFQTSKYDSGLFFLIKDGKLIGIVALHVDDFLHAGNEYFNSVILPKLLGCFKVGKSEKREFMYTGFYLKQEEDGIQIDQKKYVQNVVIPTVDVKQMKDRQRDMNQDELSLLRQITGIVNWTARATRPDLSFEMIDLSTKFKGGIVDDLIKAKNVAARLKKEEVTVKISNLKDLTDCEIVVYTDAAYRNLNNNVDSCGGYIVLIMNMKNGRVAPLEWKSGKLKRRVHSTLGAETQALYNGLDAAVGLKMLLQELYDDKLNLKVTAVTDNKSARDAVYSESEVAERILRGDIAMIKQMVEQEIVSEIKWVTGQDMLADLLTKRGVNKIALLEVLEAGKVRNQTLELIKN